MECVTPSQENVYQYMVGREKPVTVEQLRFSLDSEHGCVWGRARIERALRGLEKKGLVREVAGGWAAVPASVLTTLPVHPGCASVNRDGFPVVNIDWDARLFESLKEGEKRWGWRRMGRSLVRVYDEEN